MKGLWMIAAALCFFQTYGQHRPSTFPLRLLVRDSSNREPLPLATVALWQKGRPVVAGSSNAQGECLLPRVACGTYQLRISFVGYKSHSESLSVSQPLVQTFFLAPDLVSMEEVVVTARESHGITSSSLIKRKAMEHLQPSSFSDLLELLPGGRSEDPDLTGVNAIRLREAGSGASNPDYDISSRGIAFLMDGTPINTAADMLYLSGEASHDERRRSTAGRGVDMRTLSTDAIEQVEIIRGIPSVEYGSLTSGLVNIRRRTGGNRFRARFKADGSSKLVYIGKDLEQPERNIKWNTDIDWLSAKADPRDKLENYKRLTLSLRLEKAWKKPSHRILFSSHIDYSGSFNTDEIDPDINHNREDSYQSRLNRWSWINNMEWKSRREHAFFQSLGFNGSVSYSKDRIKEVRFCSLFRPTAAPNSTEAGEHDGVYLPFQFTGSQKTDNRPFGANARLSARFQVRTGKTEHALKAGADWQMSKNYGKGQIYDPLRPSNYTSIHTRPRPYDAIPAGHDLSFFAEDHLSLPFSAHRLELQAGVRANTQLNLPSRYRLHGKFFFDPRLNAKWTFPALLLGEHYLETELGGGIGWHTLAPSLAQLYPDPIYNDIVQLNYYHNHPDYRRLHMITYIIDPTNPDLSAARNFKWEIRGSAFLAGNQLSVTFFRERMNSGFRTGTRLLPLPYKTYDSNSIDPNTIQRPPALEELTYVQDTLMQIYGTTTNGSSLKKSGVEFQFSSKRIPALATRITVSGAYFKTVYSNSEGYYSSPDKVINNRIIPYVGWYNDPDGYVRRSFNTNFMFDTHIPKLKLGFSLSAQCLWFSDRQTERKSGIPEYYVDNQGNRHPYTEASRNDAYLQWLVKSYNEAQFERSKTEPFNLNFNLKVTKRLYAERINLALFVNRLVSWHPSYTSNGVKVRQIGRTPYFGMELNLNI